MSLKYFHLLTVALASLTCVALSAKCTVALLDHPGTLVAAYAVGALIAGGALVFYGVRYAISLADVGFIG